MNNNNEILFNNLVPERLAIGANTFTDLEIRDPRELTDYIRRRLPLLTETMNRLTPPGFDFSRKLFRAFGVDPTKYRPSSEALWRRLKKNEDFPAINPCTDLTNLLSLEFQLPYGLYDLLQLQGEIVAVQGQTGDVYQGIRKDEIRLDGKPTLKDARGPFGNPSSDSLRACTSDTSRHILQVIFFHPDYPDRSSILDESARRFLQFFHCRSHRSFFC